MSAEPNLPSDAASERRARLRKRLGLALRLVVPVLAFAYLLRMVDLEELLGSLASVSPLAIATGLLGGMAALFVAGVRWRVLFSACGIATRASVLDLFRLHVVGFFYNLYLPGGLGGDVVRALSTRHLLGERGLAGSLAIVLLERTLGLAGLLILVAINFTFFPLEAIPNVMFFSVIGLLSAAGAVTAIVLGRRLSPYLPRPLAKITASLPSIESAPHFALALLLSVVTQSAVIVVGHAIVASIAPSVALADSAVVLPLIGASQYFPLTVGGAGVREAAFVFFYGMVGVTHADALASSLVYAALFYVLGALGGLVHALWPLSAELSRAGGGEVVASELPRNA